MANVPNIFKKKLLDEGASAGTANKYACMLLTACYTLPLADAALEDETVTAFLASTPDECGSLGGTYSRQALANGGTTGPDHVNNRAALQFEKATFTSLAAGATIIGAAIVWRAVPGTPNDGNDMVAAVFALSSTPTNGGNIEVRWNNAANVGDAIYLN